MTTAHDATPPPVVPTPDALAQAVRDYEAVQRRLNHTTFTDTETWKATVAYSRAADTLILLQADALAQAEARATRYQAERDALLTLAESMDSALDLEGIGGEDHDRLRHLKANIALKDLADGNVQPVMSAADLADDAPAPADDDGSG